MRPATTEDLAAPARAGSAAAEWRGGAPAPGPRPGPGPSPSPPRRLGEVLFAPASLGYAGRSLTGPSAFTAVGPMPAGRGISIAVNCRYIQRYAAYAPPARSANPCPGPPVANPCGADPPSCQPLQPAASCTPPTNSCYGPCSPPAACTACVWPFCLQLGACAGGALICGPSGPSQGPGAPSCNPLAWAPGCADGCSPILPPPAALVPSAGTAGKGITLAAPASALVSAARQYSDPSLQWVQSDLCDASVCTIIRQNEL